MPRRLLCVVRGRNKTENQCRQRAVFSPCGVRVRGVADVDHGSDIPCPFPLSLYFLGAAAAEDICLVLPSCRSIYDSNM